ncbi:hypothetical protein ACSQ67_011212 [Phaseolus vulgaris]
MSLTSVKMSEEVWLSCVTHALSTETEEIMGLLLGDVQHSKNGNVTALIWGASPQTRSDRRKDRVETNPEQLAAASAMADRMTTATGTTTRVIGWYHSHPHITVLPSHVDVRTQAMYQLLDSGFIGLIFSCYSEDVNKVGRIQVIAFQSSDGKQNHIPRPIPLSPINRSPVIDIDSSPSSSENLSIRPGYFKAENSVQDTGDSTGVGASKLLDSVFGTGTKWVVGSIDGLESLFVENIRFKWVRKDPLKGWRQMVLACEQGALSIRDFCLWDNKKTVVLCMIKPLDIDGGRSDLGNFFANADANYHPKNSDANIVDVDPMDMSESMQEAMHRSNLEMREHRAAVSYLKPQISGDLIRLKISARYLPIKINRKKNGRPHGAAFVRREIPLYVVPASSLTNLDSPLSSYADLQHVLFEEERNAYNQAILQNMRDGKVHPLTFIHHTSTYQASLCKLIEYCLSPAISALQDRLRDNEIRLSVLNEEAKSLEAEAYNRGNEASTGSPRQVASPANRGGSSPGLRNLQGSPESSGSRKVASPGSRSRKGY